MMREEAESKNTLFTLRCPCCDSYLASIRLEGALRLRCSKCGHVMEYHVTDKCVSVGIVRDDQFVKLGDVK